MTEKRDQSIEDDTKAEVRRNPMPEVALQTFDVGTRVLMGIQDGYDFREAEFEVRAAELRNNVWEYQLNEVSGAHYRGNQWFAEDLLSFV
ncbi:hypothetical protein NX059_004430 [Plenodomus lindquistii]|nr:hypothetical protein NX059_004430 [Plenodomus lindquistii]